MPSALFKTPCGNWGFGVGGKCRFSGCCYTANAMINILPSASDSASLKLWQPNLSASKESETLNLQSSQQLHNVFVCLPSPPIVFLSPPRVGWLPCICIASGNVPIYQIFSRFLFHPRAGFVKTFHVDAKSGHWFLCFIHRVLHISLWYAYTLSYISTAASRGKHTYQ